MKQIPLGLRDGAASSFDTFVVGANAAAVSYLREQGLHHGCGEAAGAPAPVYLWGPAGSGKTHLLHALALAYEMHGARIGSFSAADPAPWALDEAWSLIVMDGCDDFDAGQQQAAFKMFVETAGQGTAIAAAGRLPPVDLVLRDDLRSRLGWGTVFALQPLGEAEVRSVLRLEAGRRGVPLSDEVIGYLLSRFERDLKSLMALLDRLDDFSLSTHRGVTVPLLKQMLTEESS